MATAKIVLSASTISQTDTTQTIKITMKFYGNGVSYSNYKETGKITFNGTTKSFSHTFTASTSAQTIGSATFTVNKTTSARALTASGSFAAGAHTSLSTLTDTVSVSIKARTSYTVKFNANGGSGAPSSQTKYYGTALSLNGWGSTDATNAPTKAGNTFLGWSASSTATTATYTSSNHSYTANASVTLYAVWSPNSYTLTYNATGGTVSPTSKSIAFGSAYGTLPTPTRSGYNFAGWWTSATGGTQVSSTTKMGASATTIYAHWDTAYVPPSIQNVKAIRCSQDGTENMSGSYVKLSFSWSKGSGSSSTAIAVGSPFSHSSTSTDATGEVDLAPVAVALGVSTTAVITLTDSTESRTETFDVSLPAGGLPVHISKSGRGVALFGTITEDDEGLFLNGPFHINGAPLVYVVESGSSNGWTYRKWSDKTFDAWGYFTVTPTSMTQQGNIYYSNWISLPKPFDFSAGYLSGCATGSNYFLGNVVIGAATADMQFRIMRGASVATMTGVPFRLILHGKFV